VYLISGISGFVYLILIWNVTLSCCLIGSLKINFSRRRTNIHEVNFKVDLRDFPVVLVFLLFKGDLGMKRTILLKFC
jgi:hypothetical protein